MTVPATAKRERHRAILDLVRSGRVQTQRELADALATRGLSATQATVSRDLQELGLVRDPRGYRPPELSAADHVRDLRFVDFMAVIQTEPGTANLVARMIDEARLEGVAGTVAGDDTIFVVVSNPAGQARLRSFLGRG